MASSVSVNKSYFNTFPNVLLSNIMTFLDLSDLFKIAHSCTRGREAANHQLTWKGRVERVLASPCPFNVVPNQYQADRAQLARIRDESVGASEREILRRGILAIQAEKVYGAIPPGLIDALGGFEAYQALPLLDLREKKDRRGEPLSVHTLSQRDLVDERGVFCPVMRGFFEEAEPHEQHFRFDFEEFEPLEQRRFIAIAVDTKDIPPVHFVLYFFEKAYNADFQNQRDNLGKWTTADLQPNYGLGSTVVQPGDFTTVRNILGNEHPLLTLAREQE